MVSEEKKIKSFFERLKEKHKLSYVNDTTYHEKWSFNLSMMNLFSLLMLYSLVIIFLLFVLIRFTPVKYLFVDNASVYELKEVAHQNQLIIDSLEHKMQATDLYLADLKAILNDEPFEEDSLQMPKELDNNYEPEFSKSSADSVLRESVENSNNEMFMPALQTTEYAFFVNPVVGKIAKTFNKKEGHFGVDVVTKKDEPILSILDGVVLFANWTSTEGNVIILQHHDNYISVYKHCSVLLKKMGDKVQIEDPIAIVGNSGEFTTGYHLHFELWQNGMALNPQEIFSF
ncbi:MAG: M23 family metallopeptidase [Putridiphycobacter sp.]